MKCIQTKEINAFITMKKYIRKFVRLNRKNSEESRYNNPNQPKPVLPEDFEFLPVNRSVVIKKEKENIEQYMDLLLEADPEKEMIVIGDIKLLIN